ncbi:hypothetical protein VTO58DRAFT_110143 [Aureobasidium pullulans]
MAQINRAAVVSQWAECMIIGKERVTAYTHLSEDEQLAYLSEGGNVAPVVLGLRKAYNDKVDRNQMLLDEIKTLTDSFDQAKARTLAHEQANDAIPDREEAERVQRLYHDTLTQLKTHCADELGLESPTVQVPFKFIPAASSNVAALFAESTEQGLVTPIPDGGYTSKDVQKDIVSLIDKSTTSGAANLAHEQDIEDLNKELRRAKEEVEHQRDTIGTLTKEKKALESTVDETSNANAALQQDYHTLELERNALAKAQKTNLEKRQDDLSEARKHKESLEEELEVQKEAKRIAEEKLILLESTSSVTTQELTEAKQQLNRSEEEVIKLKKEKAAAEKEKAESDEAVVVLQAEKDQLVKDKEEMQQEWRRSRGRRQFVALNRRFALVEYDCAF